MFSLQHSASCIPPLLGRHSSVLVHHSVTLGIKGRQVAWGQPRIDRHQHDAGGIDARRVPTGFCTTTLACRRGG